MNPKAVGLDVLLAELLIGQLGGGPDRGLQGIIDEAWRFSPEGLIRARHRRILHTIGLPVTSADHRLLALGQERIESVLA